MEGLVKGDLIVVPFPFSDLKGSKNRPALVIKRLEGDDIVMCQVTTQSREEKYSLPLHKNDVTGALPVDSLIRSGRLFTLHKTLAKYRLGTVKREKIKQVEDTLIEMITEE